jgi:hypothetical protein
MTVEGLLNAYRKLRTKVDSKIWPIVMATSAAGLTEFFCSCYINFRAYQMVVHNEDDTWKSAEVRNANQTHTIGACSGAMPATTWEVTKLSFPVLNSVILLERS